MKIHRFGLSRWQLVIVISAVVLVFGLGARVIYVVSQPVISCAPVGGSIAQSPTSLVSAPDYFAQGDYEYDQGNCDAAIAAYTRALELNPNYAEAYSNRAYTYMVKKDYADVLPDLDQAIRVRPNYVNALMNRGDIYNYYYQIDFNRAVADYDRVLALGPDAYQHTSLCGHRLLALHRGWNVGDFGDLLRDGMESGCPNRP